MNVYGSIRYVLTFPMHMQFHYNFDLYIYMFKKLVKNMTYKSFAKHILQ